MLLGYISLVNSFPNMEATKPPAPVHVNSTFSPVNNVSNYELSLFLLKAILSTCLLNPIPPNFKLFAFNIGLLSPASFYSTLYWIIPMSTWTYNSNVLLKQTFPEPHLALQLTLLLLRSSLEKNSSKGLSVSYHFHTLASHSLENPLTLSSPLLSWSCSCWGHNDLCLAKFKGNSSPSSHSFGSLSSLDFWDITAFIVILPHRLFLTQFPFLDSFPLPSF